MQGLLLANNSFNHSKFYAEINLLKLRVNITTVKSLTCERTDNDCILQRHNPMNRTLSSPTTRLIDERIFLS